MIKLFCFIGLFFIALFNKNRYSFTTGTHILKTATDCVCGNAFGSAGMSPDCSHSCTGDATETCGSVVTSSSFSVYAVKCKQLPFFLRFMNSIPSSLTSFSHIVSQLSLLCHCQYATHMQSNIAACHLNASRLQ